LPLSPEYYFTFNPLTLMVIAGAGGALAFDQAEGLAIAIVAWHEAVRVQSHYAIPLLREREVHQEAERHKDADEEHRIGRWLAAEVGVRQEGGERAFEQLPLMRRTHHAREALFHLMAKVATAVKLERIPRRRNQGREDG
jgi:hypothetical protein